MGAHRGTFHYRRYFWRKGWLMYRVRRSWADEASQIGAYDILQNAIIAVKQNPGYFIFDDVGNAVVFSMFYWAKLKKKISTYAKGQSVRVFRMGDGKWYLRNNAVVPKKRIWT